MKKEQLFEIVEFEGTMYITSQRFHSDVKPTDLVITTNRAIRNAPTYENLRADGHILEVDRKTRNTKLASLVKANSYNPVMLIDPVAQKALEHHFKVTSPMAINSSKENAMLGLLDIDLGVIAKNKDAVQAVKEIHDAQKSGKPLPLNKFRKTTLTKRLDDALSAAKKLTELSKVVKVPHSPVTILKIVSDECDVDLSPLSIGPVTYQTTHAIQPIPALPPCESEWMIPKDLGEHLASYTGVSLSPQAVNQILVKAELQVGKGKNGYGPYQVTEKGKVYSIKSQVQINTHKGVRNKQQILWDRDKVTEAIADYL